MVQETTVWRFLQAIRVLEACCCMPTEENLAEGDRRGGDNSEEAYVTFVRTFPLLKFGSGPSITAGTGLLMVTENVTKNLSNMSTF